MSERSLCSPTVYREGLFRGKAALVTGGGSGIGFSIAWELASLGCKVAIASRKLERVQEAASRLRRVALNDSDIIALQCNIRSENQVEETVRNVIEVFGALDFLVNNGGGQFPAPASLITKKGWHAVVETNLTGTFLMCREAYTQYMSSNGGAIVNITADCSNGFPGMIHTGASRAAVQNMTRTLAQEWAHAGVRVNCVAPGVTYSATAAANYGDTSFLLSAAPHIPARRLATVEEISSAVCFLLCPAAAYITGTTLEVDGGRCSHAAMLGAGNHEAFVVYGDKPPKTTRASRL